MITINKMDAAADAACGVVKNIFADAPILGLDIDGTIDESPLFYSILSRVWPGFVIIITVRSDEAKAKEYLKKFNIYYDNLILVKRLSDKAEIIKSTGVNIYVDDQDECLKNISSDVTVLKMRNPGNFNSVINKWMFSNDTGVNIDK